MAAAPTLGNMLNKAQPGLGAPTGGTGRDSPGAGKERGGFEQDRQKDRGTGKDRPPIYSPKDDGQRGGYKDRLQKAKTASNAGKLVKLMIDNGHFQY